MILKLAIDLEKSIDNRAYSKFGNRTDNRSDTRELKPYNKTDNKIEPKLNNRTYNGVDGIKKQKHNNIAKPDNRNCNRKVLKNC